MPKKKVTISVDDKVYFNFQKYCEENAIMLSKKLELIMKAILNGKIKNLMIFLFIGLSLMTLIYAFAFSDITQGDFNNGTYANTTHNGSALVLVGSNLTGSFTSRIFDASSLAQWNNISWSSTEFGELPNNQQGNLMSGNVLLMHMNEASGIIEDSSGNNNDGTHNGNYGASGKFNTALRFLDSGDSVDIPNSASLNITDNITISFWVNLAATTHSSWNYFVLDNGYKYEFGIYGNDMKPRFKPSNGSSFEINSPNALTINTWYHIVGIRDGPAIRLYVNGIQKASRNDFTGSLKSTNQGVDIGGNAGSSYLNSSIDEVAIWNRGLSVDEILDVYKKGILRLNLTARSCDDATCSGESFIDINDTSPQNLNIDNNTYFQYRFDFETDDSSYTPEIYNVSITYSILDNVAPNISIISPLNITYNTTTILFNITAADSSGVSSCLYTLNNGITNYTMSNSTSSIWNATNSTMAQGSHSVRFYCNDTLNNLNDTETKTFFIDSINPLVYIGKNTSQIELGVDSINVNWTASDSNINSVVFNITYPNGSLLYSSISNNGSINLSSPNNLSVLGIYTINLMAEDLVGNTNSTSSIFTVNDTLAPTIIISEPQQGKIYGVNLSLALNFSASDSGIGIGDCWYNIDNGINTTLQNCQNTTFNVTGDGSHILNLFLNDSLNNEGSSSVTFSVITTAPMINLIAPANNSFLNYKNNIYFNYSAISGIGISACQLLGDFSGSWQLNQTNASITQENNFFVLNLSSDGSYSLGVWCNDTQNKASMINFSFNIDTINPSLTLTEPTGSKTSRTGIPLTFSVSDLNLQSCWYNLSYDSGGGIYVSYPGKEYALLSNCSSTIFSVTNDYTYMLFLSANDSAGNLNLTNSSFIVDSSSQPPSSPPLTGGGGGGGSISPIISGINKLEIEELPGLIVNLGDSKKLTLKVRNAGTNFLNDCKIKSGTLWISSSETKNLAAGEKYNFDFVLDIPKDSKAGPHSMGLTLECQETSKSIGFSVEIMEQRIEFNIVKVERISKNEVKVIYSLKELSGIEQKIEIQFLLFNSVNEKVAEIKESKTIAGNSENEFETIIPIDSSLEGEINLLVNLNSETYSTFVQESIILGSFVIGSVIFGDTEISDNVISGVLIILFLIFAFFVIKRIKNHKKVINHTKIQKKNKILETLKKEFDKRI